MDRREELKKSQRMYWPQSLALSDMLETGIFF